LARFTRKEGVMDCPKLDAHDPSDPVCRLRSGAYVPSEDQLEALCRTARHRCCPLYVKDFEAYLHACRLEAERAVG
jgi:hypothetical protein